jgi:hypothetical protein
MAIFNSNLLLYRRVPAVAPRYPLYLQAAPQPRAVVNDEPIQLVLPDPRWIAWLNNMSTEDDIK